MNIGRHQLINKLIFGMKKIPLIIFDYAQPTKPDEYCRLFPESNKF